MFLSCNEEEKKAQPPREFQYEHFRDSVIKADSGVGEDRNNVFDNPDFIPGKDSVEILLEKLDTQLHREQTLMAQLDSLQRAMNRKDPGFSIGEKEVIRTNIAAVDSFFLAHDSLPVPACRGRECLLYAEIDKSVQTLYLYIMGELKDSFLVSTGKGKKYETPEMELHPRGPVLTKYTSRKFPGGNYLGLGNMPYAVFVKGGYAIHGTTPGNFSNLGKKASNGCIRIHPENAKVFNALVKTIGLNRTWVSVRNRIVRDTIPRLP
ncbi:MAG: L,D-transpeptidase [Chitinophagaceae bacterium]